MNFYKNCFLNFSLETLDPHPLFGFQDLQPEDDLDQAIPSAGAQDLLDQGVQDLGLFTDIATPFQGRNNQGSQNHQGGVDEGFKELDLLTNRPEPFQGRSNQIVEKHQGGKNLNILFSSLSQENSKCNSIPPPPKTTQDADIADPAVTYYPVSSKHLIWYDIHGTPMVPKSLIIQTAVNNHEILKSIYKESLPLDVLNQHYFKQFLIKQ